jgi:hypothetical protein
LAMRMDKEQFLGKICHDPVFCRGDDGWTPSVVSRIEFWDNNGVESDIRELFIHSLIWGLVGKNEEKEDSSVLQ